MTRLSAIILIFVLLFTDALLGITAQEISPYEVAGVSQNIFKYIEEVSSIADRISRVNLSGLPVLERNLEAVNFRWEAYMETEQLVIVQDENLMRDMSKYQNIYMAVSDSLTKRKVTLLAIDDFKTADAYITGVIPEYQSLYDKAVKLSLVKQTAGQLAKLKVEEQVLYQKVRQVYQKAQEAVSAAPSLSKKAEVLESNMADILMKSEKIQAMEFKPLLDRIKDYLMSLAAVSMILMFISTVNSKWAAVKSQKEAARKLKESMKNDEYPTI